MVNMSRGVARRSCRALWRGRENFNSETGPALHEVDCIGR